MRKMDENRKRGVVTGMPGILYWQDGCFFDHEGKFVVSEYSEKTETETVLKEEMKKVSFTYREPGSPAYTEAYRKTISMSSSAVKAASAKLMNAIGSYDGEKIAVYSGAGSKQKNSKTVAMFMLE